jgi:hypothetical protein
VTCRASLREAPQVSSGDRTPTPARGSSLPAVGGASHATNANCRRGRRASLLNARSVPAPLAHDDCGPGRAADGTRSCTAGADKMYQAFTNAGSAILPWKASPRRLSLPARLRGCLATERVARVAGVSNPSGRPAGQRWPVIARDRTNPALQTTRLSPQVPRPRGE